LNRRAISAAVFRPDETASTISLRGSAVIFGADTDEAGHAFQ
jgi:hypothetical protein